MTPTKGYATSLTLTGGGSYAAYEIGVMKALFAGDSPSTNKTPLDPDLLIGTSAGAMNAAGLLALEVRTGSLSGAVEALQSNWLNWVADGAPRCGNGVYRIRGLPFYYLSGNCLKRGPIPFVAEATQDAGVFFEGAVGTVADFFRSEAPRLRTLARSIDFAALISTAPFLGTLQVILPLEDFARSTRGLRVVALDLTAGQVELFNEDDVRQLGYGPLLASLALPIFFPPYQIGNQAYLNPTTLATTPLLPAIQESATMHLVYMDPDLSTINPIRLVDIVDAMDRVIVVNFAYMLNRDIQRAREINITLELIQNGVRVESLSPQEGLALLHSLAPIRARILAGNPYRPLTIHRYHPRDDLGGDLGLMNLARSRLVEIIDRGYADTVAHDCEASGCVIPGRPVRPPSPYAPGAEVRRGAAPSLTSYPSDTDGPRRPGTRS